MSQEDKEILVLSASASDAVVPYLAVLSKKNLRDPKFKHENKPLFLIASCYY